MAGAPGSHLGFGLSQHDAGLLQDIQRLGHELRALRAAPAPLTLPVLLCTAAAALVRDELILGQESPRCIEALEAV